MKNLLFFSLALLLLIGCGKDTVEPDHSHQHDITTLATDRGHKVDVCHYDADTDTWHVINISINALPAHLGHGDVRVDDQDGDGYYPDNACGIGPMGDCDDMDPTIYPGAEDICEDGIDQDCDGVDAACSNCSDLDAWGPYSFAQYFPNFNGFDAGVMYRSGGGAVQIVYDNFIPDEWEFCIFPEADGPGSFPNQYCYIISAETAAACLEVILDFSLLRDSNTANGFDSENQTRPILKSQQE